MAAKCDGWSALERALVFLLALHRREARGIAGRKTVVAGDVHLVAVLLDLFALLFGFPANRLVLVLVHPLLLLLVPKRTRSAGLVFRRRVSAATQPFSAP